MPRKRLPREMWKLKRKTVWDRDKHCCTHCGEYVKLNTCHIDHIISGKLGKNSLDNLRTLCKRCHVLRADSKHRGMIATALKEDIIPPDWRELVWED